MELTKNDPAVCPDSIDASDSSTGAVEIDLYDELNKFAALPPEEQSRLGYRSDKKRAQPDQESAAQAEGSALSEPDLAPVSAASETALDMSTALTGEDEQSTGPDMFGEPIEPGSGTIELSLPSSATPEEVQSEPALIEAQSQTGEAVPALDTFSALAEEDQQSTPRELFPTASTMEVVEPGKVEHAAEAGESETSKPSGATNGARTSGIVGPRPSGPLSGFNLPPEIVYTGAISRGVCLACGAESGADDLFCLTCGVFIDEIASTLPSNPTCAECHERIDADEIFCPWCGSSVAE